MTKIYSHINPDKLLHMIVRRGDFSQERTDLCPPEQFIQCAALRFDKGKTFRPHQHIWHRFNGDRIPQESWSVIKGRVKVFFYDLDGQLLHTDIVEAGEATFTFEGGHNYEIQENDTRILEYKTGPYLGQEHDKVFICE